MRRRIKKRNEIRFESLLRSRKKDLRTEYSCDKFRSYKALEDVARLFPETEYDLGVEERERLLRIARSARYKKRKMQRYDGARTILRKIIKRNFRQFRIEAAADDIKKFYKYRRYRMNEKERKEKLEKIRAKERVSIKTERGIIAAMESRTRLEAMKAKINLDITLEAQEEKLRKKLLVEQEAQKSSDRKVVEMAEMENRQEGPEDISGDQDLARDILWVYGRLSNLLVYDAAEDVTKLNQAELDAAPSTGARSLAEYARKDPDKFFERFVIKVLPSDLKKRDQEAHKVSDPDSAQDELDPSLDELDQYIQKG